jgi:aspartate/methionine/tyrosine aminotransferase
MTSNQFCEYILEDAGVAMLPGTSFGEFGEGFIRICYATSQDQINDAVKRIKKSISKLNLE